MPCVPSFSIIKPNFCSATLYCGVRIKISKTLRMRPNAVSASPDYRTYSGKITCQTYMFWVCMSVFQQLLPSTHQALTFYHNQIKMSIVFFFFFFFRACFFNNLHIVHISTVCFLFCRQKIHRIGNMINIPDAIFFIQTPSYHRGIYLLGLWNKTDTCHRLRHSEPS